MENNDNYFEQIKRTSFSNIFKIPQGAVVVRKKRKHKKKKNKSRNKTQHPVKKTILKAKHKCNMSSLAETYSNAASWQLKHQIAYWKAKAKALEFENRVLHDIIRKNHMSRSSSSSTVSDVPTDLSSESESDLECEIPYSIGPEDDQDRRDPDLEVSKEFLHFLTENAKYKEDARMERERLKAEQNIESDDDRIKRMEAPPSMDLEENTPGLPELYGTNWQRISALEMSMQCQFMSDCDELKPNYWPNIPFNFS